MARCHAINRDQRGAMALMSLAAILIIIMIGMVLYDVAGLGVEKTHLQTATDASAYSQATIQARSMNMIAFSNVGKRMSMGMANTYISLYQWLHSIEHLEKYSNESTSGVSSDNKLCENTAAASADEPSLDDICDYIDIIEEAAVDLRREEGERPDDYDDVLDYPDVDQVQTKIFQKAGIEDIYFNPAASSSPFPYRDVHEWAAPIGARQDLLLDVLGFYVCVMDGGSLDAGGTTHEGDDRPVACVDDIWSSWTPQRLIHAFYGRDLLAFDNYQRYLMMLTPYWAWMEGIRRGLANSAPITVSYPRPNFEQSGRVSEMPVTRGNWSDACTATEGLNRGLDSPLGVDIAEQADVTDVLNNSLDSFDTSAGNSRDVAIALATYGTMMLDDLDDPDNLVHQLLPRDWEFLCVDIMGDLLENASTLGGPWGDGLEDDMSFRTHAKPMLVNEYEETERSQWLMASSNLMFGFRPNASRFGEGGREKLFVGANPDDDTQGWGEPIYDDIEGWEAGGIWSMARSEIAFQGPGTPHTWAPEWAARMRPVSLPGEWEQWYDPDWETTSGVSPMELSHALNDIYDVLEAVTEFARTSDQQPQNDLLSHPHDAPGTTEGAEYLEAEREAINAVVDGLGVSPDDDIRMEGLSR